MGDTDTVLVKDTLGRPMRLGQLYDCRKDNPEDGASLPLWKEEDMKNGTRTLYNSGTSYSIDVEDVSSSRLSKTSMNADLKMSVCCGLASGRGSGKYVEETSSSKREVRATLEYKYVSRFEELTMDTITAQTLENMLRYRLATHVVTGVEYGVNMMFTFIKKYEDEKDYMDLRANIKAKVFWFIKVADVDYHDYRGSDRLKVKKDDLSIKYHGDVKAAPKTLEEAVILFKKVTEAIGMHKKESNNDACTIELDDKIIKFKPVAKRVWLMPLTVIDSNAPKLARTISNKLATRVQTILDGIHRLVLEAQDLKERCERDLFLQEKDGKKFYLADIPNQIDRFLEAKNKHTMQLKKGLKELLPKIREEQDRSEDELSQKLYEMMRGPFDMDKLNKWVEDKEAEAMTLVKLLRMIKKPGIAYCSLRLVSHCQHSV